MSIVTGSQYQTIAETTDIKSLHESAQYLAHFINDLAVPNSTRANFVAVLALVKERIAELEADAAQRALPIEVAPGTIRPKRKVARPNGL